MGETAPGGGRAVPVISVGLSKTDPGPRMAKSAVVSAFCMFFVLGAFTASIGASLPALREEFGSGRPVGDIVSLYNFGALAATAAIGLLGRRIRMRLVIAALLVFLAVGTAGMALSPGWTSYISFAAVAGVGYGGMTLTLNTAFARGFGERSVVMVNRLNGVFGIGAMLGPLAAGLAGRFDIRLLACAACLISLGCVLVQRAGVALDKPAPAARQPSGAAAAPRLGWSIVLFLAVGLCYAGTETSVGAWQSTQLVDDGWNTGAATIAASGFWAGMALGRFVLPRLTHRIPPSTALPLHLAAAVGMLALAAVPHLALVAYPLAGLCLAPVLPTLVTWVSHLAEVPQRATSALTLCCMLGNAVVPAVVQALVGLRGPTAIPVVLAGCCAMALCWTVALGWAQGRRA
ncbi:MFS transporter [Streptomyces ipomoeae]|uniref:Transporter, major facilitator family protein n=2 Tax=Streptomyces ipomoeae TaxID=103232 RepID=L1KTR2_9ACTN|nr:MFS transporter [Streptomyces ipomoeae]EKX63763.1 transporter, major facilitator family protein [Streptomyces ipomoeae 91-03]MDX2694785.1 MFS transporter [Streptomyces ipomoeae]MDX2824901.1 MFS transporter [Streptomyces ipomoeae]MDX2842083.1 MFS transporter [Streptomyces ipomoeae]MDX2876553.1 MFS transporter [Streptomyces ipomoeae]